MVHFGYGMKHPVAIGWICWCM